MSRYSCTNTSVFFRFVCLLLAIHAAKGAVNCNGGPTGAVTFDSFDQPAPPAVPRSNDCPLPADPNLYYIPSTWAQKRPWNPAGDFSVSGVNNGWALDPRNPFGCMKGGWCPYACKAGYIESQFDNTMGLPWAWSTSCGGQDSFIGAGKHTITCGGNTNGALCAGGKQGLYCDVDKTAKQMAPSSTSAPFYTSACIASAPGMEIENQTPWEITSCRKAMPGNGIAQIPNSIPSASSRQLVAPPVFKDGRPAWWTGGLPHSMGVDHFLSIPTLDSNNQCLTPMCQRVSFRPSTNGESLVGTDYHPYLLHIAPSGNLNGYSVNLKINCDAAFSGDAVGLGDRAYDGALGNPGYGVKIYDVNNNLVCNASWTGPTTRSDCNTVCRGARCANKQCAGATCAQAPPDCSTTTCSSAPVEPVMIRGDGTQATGAALINPCSTFFNIDRDAGKKIRIVLYPTNGAPVEPTPGAQGATSSSSSSTSSVASSTSKGATTSSSSSSSSTTSKSATSTTGGGSTTSKSATSTTGGGSTTSKSTTGTTGGGSTTGNWNPLEPIVCAAVDALRPKPTRKLTFINKCDQDIWVGAEGKPLPRNGGWHLPMGTTDTINVPEYFRDGRFWARTGCNWVNGKFVCLTGDCGGRFECAGIGGSTPATLVEFTMAPDIDYYDMSLVDGYSISVEVTPVTNQCQMVNNPFLGRFNCGKASCRMNTNQCPEELKLSDEKGHTYCMSICAAIYKESQRNKFPKLQEIYNNPDTRSKVCCACDCGPECGCTNAASKYCCSPHNIHSWEEKGGRCYVEQWPTPTAGNYPNRYDLVFKSQCPDAYSWQFDDFASTFQCRNSDYVITFCPENN